MPTFRICSVVVAKTKKGSIGNLGVPELVFGAANFSFQYNQTEHMTSDVPIRSVRLCMRWVDGWWRGFRKGYVG